MPSGPIVGLHHGHGRPRTNAHSITTPRAENRGASPKNQLAARTEKWDVRWRPVRADAWTSRWAVEWPVMREVISARVANLVIYELAILPFRTSLDCHLIGMRLWHPRHCLDCVKATGAGGEAKACNREGKASRAATRESGSGESQSRGSEASSGYEGEERGKSGPCCQGSSPQAAAGTPSGAVLALYADEPADCGGGADD